VRFRVRRHLTTITAVARLITNRSEINYRFFERWAENAQLIDYHKWPKAERAKILREINWLVDARPEQIKPLPKMRSS
jgi:hypothetical protein